MTMDPSVFRSVGSALATPLPRVLRPQRAVPTDTVRPTRAEVNLAALRHNLRVVKQAAGAAPPWAVLKADAYGHGSKAVARTLERAGCSGVCVALLEEAIELREAGIRVPILVMGGYYGRAWGEILRHELTPVVYDAGQIEAIAEEVRYSSAEAVGIHIKLDTGMGRLGAMPRDLAALAAALKTRPEVRFDGLMTHLACADAGDPASLDDQLDLFDALAGELAQLGLVPKLKHAANSAALLGHPRTHYDMVRPGIALFGVQPVSESAPGLRPVMRVRTEVVAVRDLAKGQSVGYGWTWKAPRPSRIATIPIGYADGLTRLASNRGSVLIRGGRAPVVGTVSMDLTMVDITDLPDVAVGDEVVVMGTQKGPRGEDAITAEEIARLNGTIPWEVMTNISRRVPRFYREP